MLSTDYSAAQKQLMLTAARSAIAERLGLEHAVVTVDAGWLKEEAATFVTLTIDGELRGCIGTLEAHRPLLKDLQSNAANAAFSDPRFPPVTAAEYPQLQIHISILNEPKPVYVHTEADLLSLLRPGIDGVVLRDGGHRATFLPQVWQQLPEPEQFLRHLKLKAGLAPDHWSDTISVSRYQVTEFGEGG